MILDSNSASGGYEIANSLKLEQDNTEYLHKTPTSSGNRRTFTLSAWIKRTESDRGSGGGDYIFQAGDGDYNQSDRTLLKFNHDDTIYWGGGSAYEIKTNRIFRDTSAWYHIAMIVDTTDSTAGDRLKLYVNGVRETDLATNTNPSQNFQYAFMKDDKHTIGYNHTDSSNPASMYIAEVVWLDGTAASITDLGKFDDDTGIWVPIDVSGLSVGTNGCYLDFEDSSTLGNDVSGGTDFTLNNIAAIDQATDVPTNNFNVWTNRYNYGSSYSAAITEGGTKIAHPHASWSGAKGNYGLINGKWYWEFTTMGNLQNVGFGIQSTTTSTSLYNHHAIQNNNTIFIGYSSLNYYYWTGGSQTSNESTGWVSGFTVGAGDVYGFALDLDSSTKKFFLYRNGTLLNGASGTNLPTPMQDEYVSTFIGAYNGDGTRWNFGGYTSATVSSGNSDANGYGNFEYSVPSGYYAICSKNVAEYA